MIWTTLAWAVTVNAKICINYDLDFVDSGVGEDYYASNGLSPARGVLVEATFPSTPTVSAHTNTSGTDVGCVLLPLDDSHTWNLQVVSKVEADANHSLSVKKGSNGALFVATWTGYQPASYLFTTETKNLPVKPYWNTLAVASRALTRNLAGHTSFDLDVFMPDNSGNWSPPGGCDPDASCLDGTDLWLHTDESDRKFLTAYRLGWVMLHLMGYDRSSVPKNASDTYCHVADQALTLGNLEHTGAGFVEGYAHWYSASVFNQTDEADCAYVFWLSSDWDQLDVCHEEEEAAIGHTLSCAVGPQLPPYEELIPETNYRGYCLDDRNPGLSAASKPADTVVPLDALRFFHERVYEDAGLDRYDLGNVLANAVGLELDPDDDAGAFRYALRTEAVTVGADDTDWVNAIGAHGLDD